MIKPRRDYENICASRIDRNRTCIMFLVLFYFISFIVDNKNIYVYYPYVYRDYIGRI